MGDVEQGKGEDFSSLSIIVATDSRMSFCIVC